MAKQKSNLIEECADELLGEGISLFANQGQMEYGASGGGGGSFSHSGGKNSPQHWHHKSPTARHMTGEPTPDELTGIVQAEEEEAHHAPKIRPYPLETITDQLVQAYLNLGIVEVQLKNCITHNAFIKDKKEKKKVLEFLKDKTGAIKEMIKSMSEELDRITVSD